MERRSLCDVLAAARRNRDPALLVDVKCRSPQDGQLIQPGQVEPYVRALLAAGVDGLATATDAEHFGGSLEIARRIRGLSNLPLMRKEFFTSVAQMDESRQVGFDAVQLSLSTIPDMALVRAMKDRAEELGLEVVIAIHDGPQLDQAVELNAAVVGINNRDIAALEMDDGSVDQTEVLMSAVPDDVLTISESGLRSRADVARAVQAGADGVLVGTAVAKNGDPIAAVRELRSGMSVARLR